MNVVIIGGGAAGLVAAIEAGKRGYQVTLLEQAEKLGKKIYATGNGKCNLSNMDMDVKKYRSTHPMFVKKTLERFGVKDTIGYFENLGLLLRDKNGYLYPSTGQASSVAECLAGKCYDVGVQVKTNTKALKVRKTNEKFLIDILISVLKEKKVVKTQSEQIWADKVILALGTRAGGFGCDITGEILGKSLGHKIISVVPALTALRCENEEFFKQVSGVRCDGRIEIWSNGRKLAQDTGELQLTDYGFSGIPTFQISRYGAYALAKQEKVTVTVDFLPEYSEAFLNQVLEKSIKNNNNRSILEVLAYIYNGKLVKGILAFLHIQEQELAIKISRDQRARLIETLKNFRVRVKSVNEVKNAQICAGGIDVGQIKDTFESKIVDDLYIVGEMLDVDGICGGYNLQFAWAGGYIAGNSL